MTDLRRILVDSQPSSPAVHSSYARRDRGEENEGGTMTKEEKEYTNNLEILVKARTEQLRTAMHRVEELEKLLADQKKSPQPVIKG